MRDENWWWAAKEDKTTVRNKLCTGHWEGTSVSLRCWREGPGRSLRRLSTAVDNLRSRESDTENCLPSGLSGPCMLTEWVPASNGTSKPLPNGLKCWRHINGTLASQESLIWCPMKWLLLWESSRHSGNDRWKNQESKSSRVLSLWEWSAGCLVLPGSPDTSWAPHLKAVTITVIFNLFCLFVSSSLVYINPLKTKIWRAFETLPLFPRWLWCLLKFSSIFTP